MVEPGFEIPGLVRVLALKQPCSPTMREVCALDMEVLRQETGNSLGQTYNGNSLVCQIKLEQVRLVNTQEVKPVQYAERSGGRQLSPFLPLKRPNWSRPAKAPTGREEGSGGRLGPLEAEVATGQNCHHSWFL